MKNKTGAILFVLLIATVTVPAGPGNTQSFPGYTVEVPAISVDSATDTPYQVEIEVVIADLAKDFTKDLGFIYRFDEKEANKDREVRLGPSSILLPGTTDGGVLPVFNRAFGGLDVEGQILEISWGALDARLQAAIGRGEGEILTRPRIKVITGQTASLKTGGEFPYLSRKLGTEREIYTSEYVNIGVIMVVQPTVLNLETPDHSDDMIEVRLSVSVEFISRFLLDSSLPLPVLASRDMQSVIIVRDNHTFGIGGLYREDIKLTSRKVPFLGDQPLIGPLFTSRNESRSKFEMVIFVTPRIDRNIADELDGFGAIGGPEQ